MDPDHGAVRPGDTQKKQRLFANRAILAIIEEAVESGHDLRFGQILANLSIVIPPLWDAREGPFWEDEFHLEPYLLLDRVVAAAERLRGS